MGADRLSRMGDRISPPAARRPSLVTRLILPSFFLLALLYLWPLSLHPNFIAFPPKSEFTDLLITHLPNAEYVRDSLARYGQLPLWNAQMFAGQPFAADPLAGMWYPPGWLLLVRSVPLPFAFNLLLALHVAWAGYGLYRLLRDEGLPPGPAFLGGLAFCGTPKLIAHLGAGHVSLVCAVSWTPWLMLAVKRAASGGGLKHGALAGASLALIFLADVRWAFYAGGLGAAYWLVLLSRVLAHSGPPPRPLTNVIARSEATKQSTRLFFAVGPALAFGGIFLSLSAVLALPLAEFLSYSNRSALTLAEAAVLSLPPYPYLLGLVIPDLGGFYEWMTYLGVVPLLLSFLGLSRGKLFWAAVVLCAVAFSLGANFGFFPLLFRLLPGLGFLRVPPRAWFIVAFGVCLLAAHGAQSLISDLLPRLAQRYARPSLTYFVSYLLPLLCLLTALDLLRVDSTLLVARPRPARVPAAEWIAAQPGLFRVYSPSYSLPPGDGLQHVDGVNPLQLAASVKFIESASGVHASSYSVTLPAFEAETPEAPVDLATANAEAAPDARLLGLLNVKYVAAEFPLTAPGLSLAQIYGRTRVYENVQAVARAGVITPASEVSLNNSPATSLAGVEADRAEIQFLSPNRVELRAAGPGRLILSEVIYPGWQVWVDGVGQPIEMAGGLLRSVVLASGEHEVIFEFHPLTVYVGAAISLLGLIALIGLWRWGK